MPHFWTTPIILFISKTLSKKSVSKRIPRINPPKSSQPSVFVQETMFFSYPSPPHIQQQNKTLRDPRHCVRRSPSIHWSCRRSRQHTTWLVASESHRGQGQGWSKPCWEPKRFKKMPVVFCCSGGVCVQGQNLDLGCSYSALPCYRGRNLNDYVISLSNACAGGHA